MNALSQHNCHINYDNSYCTYNQSYIHILISTNFIVFVQRRNKFLCSLFHAKEILPTNEIALHCLMLRWLVRVLPIVEIGQPIRVAALLCT